LLKAGLLGDGSELHDVTITFGPASASVLASFGESFGNIPPVLLRDADSSTDPGPVIRPSSPEIPDPSDRSARLQLFGEIARGGMGAVFKGRDSDLGRDLAVKILLESHRDKPEMIRRFIEEAQIAGQLQHPGIVPIYELGAFGDHRPYFAMKLVKGHTLAELLAKRKTPGDGLPRFLSIFESICQTMAYAHARGVIHRDLKPSNVMVGSFGEVQVMDWGLAKVLPRGGAVEDASAGQTKDRGTVIATAGNGSDSDLSQAGSIMGTPSYMAPEQARGEGDQVDERADVFALGSIFCELLTGEPAFNGRSSGEIQRKAARGEVSEAYALLDLCGADAELTALAKSCLAPEPEDRAAHAGEVSDRVRAYQAGVQERLKQVEIARASEAARAEEATKRARVERDRLRLTVALAASVFGLIALGGSGWVYLAQQRASRRAATEHVVIAALDEAMLLQGQARAALVSDLSRWPAALSAANRAKALLLAGESDPGLCRRVDQLAATLQQEQAGAAHRAAEADRDRKFIERLNRIRLTRFERGEKWEPASSDAEYATAFREFGIDVDTLDPMESSRRLKARSDPLELAFFLDDWAYVRRDANRPDVERQRLIATAQAVDSDPWRNKLRTLIDRGDGQSARRIAADQKALASQPGRSLFLLANVLEFTRDQKADESHEPVIELLKRAWRLNPNDFQICRALVEVCENQENWAVIHRKNTVFSTKARMDKVRFATAAVAANPWSAPSHAHLAFDLLPSGASEEFTWRVVTSTVYPLPKEALPNEDGPLPRWALKCGENHLVWAGPSPPIEPKKADLEDLDDAIAECIEAIRLDPTQWYVRHRLGNALLLKGEIEKAVAEYREATRLASNAPPKDRAWMHREIAYRLYLRGSLDLAIAETREAIRLDPTNDEDRLLLGITYHEQGKLSQAFSEYREAFLRKRIYGWQTYALLATGKLDDVLKTYRELLSGVSRPGPEDARFFNQLAWTLAASSDAKLRDAKGAVEFATKACELSECKNPEFLGTLSAACAESGDFDAAVKWQTKAIDLASDQKEKEGCRKRLKLYQEKKPYRLRLERPGLVP
jgi:serine/threonine-protein kinase